MGQSALHLAHPSTPPPPTPHLYPPSPIITELKQRRFWVMQFNWKWVFFPKIYLLFAESSTCYRDNNVPEKCRGGGGGDSAYERGGDARQKFWIKPLKETDLGMAQAFFDP